MNKREAEKEARELRKDPDVERVEVMGYESNYTHKVSWCVSIQYNDGSADQIQYNPSRKAD